MPLAFVSSVFVFLFSGNFIHVVRGALLELVLLGGTYYFMRRLFRKYKLTIDQDQVSHHLAYYDPSDFDADNEKMKETRRKEYLDLAKNYYNLTTQIFHTIWSPHYSMGIQFPIEPSADKDEMRLMNYPQCQSVYQCYLALALGANENTVIGDFGCGTGGPTRCIAQFSGSKIKAVNINEGHLATMKRWNEKAGIAHKIELIQADYHKTPIESNSLDGLYMCESAACTYDHKVLCKEVFRVLKPGAKFCGFDWQMTDKFDESNKEHRKIRYLLELGVGVPRLVTMDYMREALKEAGFKITTVRNHNDFAMSLGGKPWDHLFLGYKSKFWMTSVVRAVVRAGEILKMVKPHSAEAIDIMVTCREGMLRGGPLELDIFTPMAYWLAEKPKE